MNRNPIIAFLLIVGLFGILFAWATSFSFFNFIGSGSDSAIRVGKKNSILHIRLEGVIIQSRKFIKQLDRYSKDPDIKAIVVDINSPGGVVGPSQEIYLELKRLRANLKKPVVAVSTGLIASGAYYAALGADQIVAAPGALVGSIGVVMEFVNLEKLYEWAKVSRFTVTTGKYKDSGAEYRTMREDERALFQDLANEVYGQFKSAVIEARGLDESLVNQYADGRVFTGAKAVELKFADKVGTFKDATDLAAQLAGIKPGEYEVFEVPKFKPNPLNILMGGLDEEDAESMTSLKDSLKTYLRTEMLNQPVMVMPGFFGK